MTSCFIGVVDDDGEVCSSLADLMRSSGHRAEAFLSAETLLVSSNLPCFDCIVADIHMSGMSGLDLVRKLREQGCAMPVILITALPDKHLDVEVHSVGAVCLLRKPIEADVLLERIDESAAKERPEG